MNRPAVLVARAVFPEVLQHLRQHFEVEDNQADTPLGEDGLIARLQGKQGLFVTAGDPVSARVVSFHSQLQSTIPFGLVEPEASNVTTSPTLGEVGEKTKFAFGPPGPVADTTTVALTVPVWPTSSVTFSVTA